MVKGTTAGWCTSLSQASWGSCHSPRLEGEGSVVPDKDCSTSSRQAASLAGGETLPPPHSPAILGSLAKPNRSQRAREAPAIQSMEVGRRQVEIGDLDGLIRSPRHTSGPGATVFHPSPLLPFLTTCKGFPNQTLGKCKRGDQKLRSGS